MARESEWCGCLECNLDSEVVRLRETNKSLLEAAKAMYALLCDEYGGEVDETPRKDGQFYPWFKAIREAEKEAGE
jgi:hypothetical protein